jgi:GNAT superfamily N-acetyltransferase
MSPGQLEVRPAAESELDGLLSLIAAYQAFYGAPAPERERNRAFFARFVAPSELGVLLGAWRAGEPVGFGCIYWTHSSVSARDVALLNDLYVDAAARGAGVGAALIAAAAAAARERGLGVLRWLTEPANLAAQRLYERTGASSSRWIEYELELGR